MFSFWIILIFVSHGFSAAVNASQVPFVEPEVLNRLLENGKYEEFSRLLRIDNVNLVIPQEGDKDPMFNKELPMGDILFSKKQTEEGRLIINFQKHPGSKWPNGIVPYTIASDGYTPDQIVTIQRAIADFNSKNTGARFVPRQSQKDYVLIFSGEGCYSYVGRIGDQQPLSLQRNGCVQTTTIQHEMMHALGFQHENNRPDRDDYIKVLWDNIPSAWRSQFEKITGDNFIVTTDYDYCSIMHVPMYMLGTGRRVFEILRKGSDENCIGTGMTDLDIQKIRNSYP